MAVALLTNGGDTFSLYRDIVSHVLAELADVDLPALPRPPEEPQRIDAGRYVGTYSAEVADLVVTQDDDGRIWIDMTPKGIAEEIGEKAERKELVHYAGDSLIPIEADRGMYMPHAFVGDDGQRPRPLPPRRAGHPTRRRLTLRRTRGPPQRRARIRSCSMAAKRCSGSARSRPLSSVIRRRR